MLQDFEKVPPMGILYDSFANQQQSMIFTVLLKSIIKSKLLAMSAAQWNEQADALLGHLYQKQALRDWNLICQALNNKLGPPFHSSKQCKERYMKDLQNKRQLTEWTPDEVSCLKESYLEKGPKWVHISKLLQHKSQNSIKNKFNGSLRKCIRKLNRISKRIQIKHRKPIDTEWFRKLSKSVFDKNEAHQQKIDFSRELLKQLLNLIFLPNNDEQTEEDETVYQEILDNICLYNKSFLFCKNMPNVKFMYHTSEDASSKFSFKSKNQDGQFNKGNYSQEKDEQKMKPKNAEVDGNQQELKLPPDESQQNSQSDDNQNKSQELVNYMNKQIPKKQQEEFGLDEELFDYFQISEQ